jgi:hypothetical protein
MIRKLLRRVTGVEALGAWTRHQLTGVRASVAAAEKHGKSTGKKLKELRETVALERRKAAEAEAAVATQRNEIAALSTRLAQVERLADANERLAKLLFRSDPQEIAATTAHVRAAVLRSMLCFEPGPHVVIDDVLPEAVYARLLAAIPPVEFFTGGGDGTKLDYRVFSSAPAPTASRVIWETFESEIVREALMPALLDLFAPALADHFAGLFGPDFAAEAARLPTRANGRIMLRRPGFTQAAHLDPKRSVITGILYLARSSEGEEYGTHLYRVDRPVTAPSMTTYYLTDDQVSDQAATRVAFRPNRVLAFVNSVAHGAEFPKNATLRERLAYQFYIKPRDGALANFLRKLPAERQQPWSEMLATHDRV